jgi:hypothetical protein
MHAEPDVQALVGEPFRVVDVVVPGDPAPMDRGMRSPGSSDSQRIVFKRNSWWRPRHEVARLEPLLQHHGLDAKTLQGCRGYPIRWLLSTHQILTGPSPPCCSAWTSSSSQSAASSPTRPTPWQPTDRLPRTGPGTIWRCASNPTRQPSLPCRHGC